MGKARKDEQKMNQKQIIGAVVAAGLFIVTGVSSVLTNTLSERMLADTAKKDRGCAVRRKYDNPSGRTIYWDCCCGRDDSGTDFFQRYI